MYFALAALAAGAILVSSNVLAAGVSSSLVPAPAHADAQWKLPPLPQPEDNAGTGGTRQGAVF